MKIQDTRIDYSKPKKIYSKKVNEDCTIEFYRKDSKENYIWELNTTIFNKKSNIKKILIEKKDILQSDGFSYGTREGYQEKFNIVDVLVNNSNKELIVLFDKFGQIDLHIFKLNTEITETIIHIKNYIFLPMDEQLLGEKIQDFKLVNGNIYLLTLSESGNNQYYFYTVNSDSKVKEYIFDVSNFQKNSVEILENTGSSISSTNFNDKNIVTKILSDVIQKTTYKEKNFQYSHNIENFWSKENYINKKIHIGNQFFFVEIDQKSKIILFDGTASWYIGDYNYLPFKSNMIKNIDTVSISLEPNK